MRFKAPSADQVAAVMYPRIPPGTVSVQHLAPHHQVSLATVLLDQLVDVVAALAVALGALDEEHVELAFDVAEDEISMMAGAAKVCH
jgi:hypothetical protein